MLNLIVIVFIVIAILSTVGGLYLIKRDWHRSNANVSAGIILLSMAVLSLLAVLITYSNF
ncbi:hypothetical protein [Chungangia koreensis]|uniref:hypothetical protein n=1 Tax=Chungangia koreensis TaxID=752657 RepID=UPI00366FF200